MRSPERTRLWQNGFIIWCRTRCVFITSVVNELSAQMTSILMSTKIALFNQQATLVAERTV